jgi:hypothetical protein
MHLLQLSITYSLKSNRRIPWIGILYEWQQSERVHNTLHFWILWLCYAITGVYCRCKGNINGQKINCRLVSICTNTEVTPNMIYVYFMNGEYSEYESLLQMCWCITVLQEDEQFFSFSWFIKERLQRNVAYTFLKFWMCAWSELNFLEIKYVLWKTDWKLEFHSGNQGLCQVSQNLLPHEVRFSVERYNFNSCCKITLNMVILLKKCWTRNFHHLV